MVMVLFMPLTHLVVPEVVLVMITKPTFWVIRVSISLWEITTAMVKQTLFVKKKVAGIIMKMGLLASGCLMEMVLLTP